MDAPSLPPARPGLTGVTLISAFEPVIKKNNVNAAIFKIACVLLNLVMLCMFGSDSYAVPGSSYDDTILPVKYHNV